MIGQVIPGDEIGNSTELSAGDGVYILNDRIYSSLHGKVVIKSEGESRRRVHVISPMKSVEVIDIGDEVICQVTRILLNQINVDILVLGDKELKQSTKGIVRREDSRLSEIDKVIMSDLFRPGDLIRASVISLGDAKQYYLSTAAVHLGVIVARNEKSGGFMLPISFKVCIRPTYYELFCFILVIKEMQDPTSSEKETRKVAKP